VAQITVTVIVPVTDITGVAAEVAAGTPLPLSGTIAPPDATNKTIIWTVKDQGGTGGNITGNTTLNTTGAGTVTVTAAVANGIVLANNTLGDYTKDFTITVKAQGPLDISIGFNLGKIAVAGDDGTNIIYKNGVPSSLILTASPEYTDVVWYVDANPGITDNPITINAEDYTAQPHTITFMGKKGEGYYSQPIPFTVEY
jgi:hypothetical protein